MTQTQGTFRGGLRLHHQKELAMAAPLDSLPHPKCLYVPLAGYKGHLPNDLERALIVKPGECVTRCQALTESGVSGWPTVHAPLAGVVRGLCTRISPRQPSIPLPCLEIEVDPDQPVIEAPMDEGEPSTIPIDDTSTVLSKLSQMGIVGQGGAQFPTAQKLTCGTAKIHTLIINGVECEPFIACDEALMRRRPAAIVQGALCLARLVGPERIIFAFEDPLKETLGSVRRGFEAYLQHTHDLPPIECITVPAIYPQGAEQQLIKTLLNLELAKQQRPIDAGIVVCNVATAASVYDALSNHQPLTHRIVSVTGGGIASPRNIYAPIGAPISALIKRAGGLNDSVSRLLLGGPLSGYRIDDPQTPIDKGALCILAISKDEDTFSDSSMPCINCGFCVPVCPAGLLPQQLYKLASHQLHESAQALGLSDCIECGLCAAVCPSHLPLVEWYRHSKSQWRVEIEERTKAETAKRRHEVRQERLAAEDARREEKRRRHEARLRKRDVAQSDVEAAISRAQQKKSQNP